MTREEAIEYLSERVSIGGTSECVRDVIYKDKENIVDRIVAQASQECRTKAIKKLLEEARHEQ